MEEGSLSKQYRVIYKGPRGISLSTSKTIFTTNRVESNFAYNFTIYAYNRAGNGEFSNEATFYTCKKIKVEVG